MSDISNLPLIVALFTLIEVGMTYSPIGNKEIATSDKTLL